MQELPMLTLLLKRPISTSKSHIVPFMMLSIGFPDFS